LLEWEAPQSALPISGYKVYLGTGPDPVTLIYDGPALNYQPSGLGAGSNYYWKVVPYNTYGEAMDPPVWSFSTVRDEQLVESFEADYVPPVSWLGDGLWYYDALSVYENRSIKKGISSSTPSKLITPLLHIVSGDKIEFFSHAVSSQDLRIQLMYSLNKSSWTNIGDPVVIPLNAWVQTSIDLSSLAGNDYYLAFGIYKTSGGVSGNVLIDHVTGPDIIPVLPATATNPDPADQDGYIPLSVDLYWDPIVWGGIPDGYRVYFGTAPVPVNLIYDGTDELCDPGPLQLNTTYYWKVIPYNSVGDAADCPVWSFSTIPEGGVQIGRESVSAIDLPIYPDYSYSYTQALYLQQEINIPGKRVAKVYYFWSGGEDGTNFKDWTIYMGHTAKTAFSSNVDWVPVAQMSQVFNGEVAIPETEGWVEIELDVPFNYNNTDNLVIAVDENTYGYSEYIGYFHGTWTTGMRGIKYFSDEVNPVPASPPTADGTIDGIANLRLLCEDLPTGPVMKVLPGSFNFGDVPYGFESNPQIFKIKNSGIGSLNIQDVVLSGIEASHFEISHSGTYPVTLNANQSVTVTLTFSPLSGGMKTANISITHDQVGSPMSIPLIGTGIDPVVSVFPFTETFENSSVYRPAWTQVQENGTGVWTYAAGAGDGNIATAHGGALNVRFTSSYEQNIAKLVSPVLNLSNVINPQVDFWYGQEFWDPDQNELKVYYRTGESQPWTEIFHDNTDINDWSLTAVSLPEPSSTYQIAFEGIDNYGYPNVLDDIEIGSAPAPTTTWIGTTSDDWNLAANWTNGVPGPTHEVIIMSGDFYPVISTTITILRITVESGAEFIISPTGTLTITGNQ
jgi:hypothetical protein